MAGIPDISEGELSDTATSTSSFTNSQAVRNPSESNLQNTEIQPVLFKPDQTLESLFKPVPTSRPKPSFTEVLSNPVSSVLRPPVSNQLSPPTKLSRASVSRSEIGGDETDYVSPPPPKSQKLSLVHAQSSDPLSGVKTTRLIFFFRCNILKYYRALGQLSWFCIPLWKIS